jgi:hypothetical protein
MHATLSDTVNPHRFELEGSTTAYWNQLSLGVETSAIKCFYLYFTPLPPTDSGGNKSGKSSFSALQISS